MVIFIASLASSLVSAMNNLQRGHLLVEPFDSASIQGGAPAPSATPSLGTSPWTLATLSREEVTEGDTNALNRFLAKVRVNPDTGCWEWTSWRDRYGYGCISIGGKRNQKAHRVAYQLYKGQLTDGLQIDHLCRNRGCVNPDHLEEVTPRENTLRSQSVAGINARKTHCVNGHAFISANIYTESTGRKRVCRACTIRRVSARYWARKTVPA